MPTSVSDLFQNVNVNNIQNVKWGDVISEKEQGVYVISLSDDKNYKPKNVYPEFDVNAIQQWIDKAPDFKINSKAPTVESVKQRLMKFWLPDESILYIGKAPRRKNGKGIGNRLSEFYRTKIGSRSPHAGGHWFKTFKNLRSFSIFYAVVDDPAGIEYKMLNYFMESVSKKSLKYLKDKRFPMPFANVRLEITKDHGFTKQVI